MFGISEVDRYAGTYIDGNQGYGKSGLLENMILADCQSNQAVVVIDPHEDLVDKCLAALPEHLVPKTYLLDLADSEFPFNINVLSGSKPATEDALSAASERLHHIFGILWPEVLTQHYLPLYMQAATAALLANPGKTLVDMCPFIHIVAIVVAHMLHERLGTICFTDPLRVVIGAQDRNRLT